MYVRFYKYNKRKNSTAAPTGSYTEYNCILKGASGITNPIIALDVGITDNPEYNYAYIPDWNRYYVITNWNWNNRLWEAQFSEDYLASWKSAIQAASAFVLYDTSANTELTDSRLSMNTTLSASQASGNFGFLGSTSLLGNVVIVTITGKDSTAAYALNVPTVKTLLNDLTNWLDEQQPEPTDSQMQTEVNALQWLVKIFLKNSKQVISTGNAADNIRSAFQLPFAMGNVPGENSTIYLGEYETNVVGKSITNNRIIRDSATVSIPWQAADWRRNKPFHEIFLYNPFSGLIQLSNSDLIGVNSLTVNAVIDMLTGDAVFETLAGGKCISQTTANLAASYPIGASNITPGNVASNLLSAGAGVIASGMTGNYAGAAASAVQGIYNAVTPSTSCVNGGGGGAALGLSGSVKCFTIYHNTNVPPDSVSAIMGTPAMAVKNLSGLSGYVQTSGASVAGAMLDEERETINNMLDSGIYIE